MIRVRSSPRHAPSRLFIQSHCPSGDAAMRVIRTDPAAHAMWVFHPSGNVASGPT